MLELELTEHTYSGMHAMQLQGAASVQCVTAGAGPYHWVDRNFQ